jgi:hypothetical protein
MSTLLRVALGLLVGLVLGTLPFVHFRHGAGRHDAAPGDLHATHTH